MTEQPPPDGDPDPAVERPRGRLGFALLVAALSASLAGPSGYLVAQHQHPGAEAEKGLYQCPMHPTVVQDHPGNCPICGMKLVKVVTLAPAAPTQDALDGGAPIDGMATVTIDPARQQLIGLKTAEVTRGSVGGSFKTFSRVAVDERRVRHVSLKVPVFVEHVAVNFIGKKVGRGEALFSGYSPELLTAQAEYRVALESQKTLASLPDGPADGGKLVKAARRKLELLDIPPAAIKRLDEGGEPLRSMTFVSPIEGVVVKKDVVDGMKLEAGAMPYEIVDLSSVWVLVDIYESDLPRVRVGMTAKLSLKAFPTRAFEGTAAFIDPVLDPVTRTVKLRLDFPNPAGDLRPGMFGQVTLDSALRQGLRIPKDAVIDSGTRKVVFVALGAGKLQPREVSLGDSEGAFVEVVSGLVEGEKVVVRANFLVDSESQLRAALASVAK